MSWEAEVFSHVSLVLVKETADDNLHFGTKERSSFDQSINASYSQHSDIALRAHGADVKEGRSANRWQKLDRARDIISCDWIF
jgi:hypothetical protein